MAWFINDKGVTKIKNNESNWFQFLSYSRITNSISGGWNYKELWTNFLNDFINNKVFTKITTNTLELDKDSEPEIRKSNFKFDRKDSVERSKTKNITQTHFDEMAENQIQGLIINKKHFFRTEIIGYEIPLTDQKKGQLKIDLFGIRVNYPVLIELKKSDNHKDSPLLALVELLCYYFQLLRCKDNIAKKIPNGINPDFSQIYLILAAPEKYWEYWIEKDLGLVKNLVKIVDEINLIMESHKVKVELEVYKLLFNAKNELEIPFLLNQE